MLPGSRSRLAPSMAIRGSRISPSLRRSIMLGAHWRDWRDRTDAHAIRQGHLARRPHVPAAERPARLILENHGRLLRSPRRRADGVRRRDQEGVSQARDDVPPRPQQRLEGSRGEVQGDHRGVRRAARSAEARGLRSIRRGGTARRWRRIPPRRSVRSARHFHAGLRRIRRTRRAVWRRARRRVRAPAPRSRSTCRSRSPKSRPASRT